MSFPDPEPWSDDELSDLRKGQHDSWYGIRSFEAFKFDEARMENMMVALDAIEDALGRESSGRRTGCRHPYCLDNGDGDCLYDEEEFPHQ